MKINLNNKILLLGLTVASVLPNHANADLFKCVACSNKPANSSYTSSGNGSNNCSWSCNSGYTKKGNNCCANPPANATLNANNCGWSCNAGYKLVPSAGGGSSCEKSCIQYGNYCCDTSIRATAGAYVINSSDNGATWCLATTYVGGYQYLAKDFNKNVRWEYNGKTYSDKIPKTFKPESCIDKYICTKWGDKNNNITGASDQGYYSECRNTLTSKMYKYVICNDKILKFDPNGNIIKEY
ncbi:MAG: hypothetical protein ACI4N3_04345 [Alphaproteobacteria bacterium]